MDVQILAKTNGVEKTNRNNGYSGKSITEAITNGFFTVDRKWTVKYWNKSAEKLLGVRSEDIVGKNIWEQFAGSIPVDFYSVYHQAFLQDVPVHMIEYWGEKGIWLDIITYHTGDTLSVSFKSSNQPAQLQHPENPEYQLKMLSELYRLVTEITNDCLWEWDLVNKEVFWIDGGHKRVFGYQIENALIPQSFWESRIHPEDRARTINSLNDKIVKREEGIWECEYRFQKANGEYAYVCDRGHIVFDETDKASRMIGATQDITRRVLLEQKIIRERAAKYREITNAVLTAQDHERSEIGKELHDNLNQTLAVAKMYIQMARTYSVNQEMYLEKSTGFISSVIEEIRRIAKNLVVPEINIIGLYGNIRNLLNDLGNIHPIKIQFINNGIEESDLTEKLQLTLFRIVQEQLNNIVKHSKASSAVIDLSRKEEQLILLISDNGEGCDVTKQKNGVGLINIQSRADIYHGDVIITSKPGEGYEMKVVLMLNTFV